MRRSRVRTPALAAALTLGALGTASVAPAAATPAPTAGAPAPVSVAVVRVGNRQVAAVDRAFLVAAHDSNLNEILAGRLALQRATDERVRALGGRFVVDHTQLDRRAQRVANRLGLGLPGAPSAQTQLELALLETLSGASFDRAWLAQQLVSHARSIVATEAELAAGRQRLVVELAAATAPVVQAHYEELRAVAADYGIPAPALADLLGALRAGPSAAALRH